MTPKHENDERDERVSEVYRELGVEQAPELLNQTILQMAANGGIRPSSSRLLLSAWMKPVAWAATIGLSLAIVLEVTQNPSMDSPTFVAPNAAVPMPIKEKDNAARAVEQDKLEEQISQPVPATAYEQEARELGSLQDSNGPAREGKLVRRQASTPAAEPTADPAPNTTLETVPELRIESRPDTALKTAPAPASNTVTTGVVAGDADQSTARKRSGDQAIVAEEFAALASSSALMPTDIGPACDTEVRRSKDDWLSCIEELRTNGANDQADLEYEAYILEYPAESAPNK